MKKNQKKLFITFDTIYKCKLKMNYRMKKGREITGAAVVGRWKAHALQNIRENG